MIPNLPLDLLLLQGSFDAASTLAAHLPGIGDAHFLAFTALILNLIAHDTHPDRAYGRDGVLT